MAIITATALKLAAQALLKKMATKAVKAKIKAKIKDKIKDKIKSKFKRKKVKGKDVAKKMFGGGGEDKGGALALQPKADLVPSPGGAIKPK